MMTRMLMFFLLLVAPLFAEPVDDDFFVQRMVGSANVISAQLDYAGKVTAMAIRKNQPLPTPILSTPDLSLLPHGAATTARVNAARAQAAGAIGSAWMRYCGEVNAACLDTNQAPKIASPRPHEIYNQVLNYR